MKRLILVALIAAGVACTDEEGATRVLKQQGYTEVRMTGYKAGLCSDTYASGFEATSPNGMRVEGAVCSGVLKGYMIRFK